MFGAVSLIGDIVREGRRRMGSWARNLIGVTVQEKGKERKGGAGDQGRKPILLASGIGILQPS